jgi:hypothetical protein
MAAWKAADALGVDDWCGKLGRIAYRSNWTIPSI